MGLVWPVRTPAAASPVRTIPRSLWDERIRTLARRTGIWSHVSPRTPRRSGLPFIGNLRRLAWGVKTIQAGVGSLFSMRHRLARLPRRSAIIAGAKNGRFDQDGIRPDPKRIRPPPQRR